MSVPPPAALIACPACGLSCDPEARFCPHCGRPVARPGPARDVWIGQVVGRRHRIVERIGADALGRLYRAEIADAGGHSTVRILHEHLSSHRGFSARFEDAARTAASIAVPGVMRLLEAGHLRVEGRSSLYTVQETFEGRNLCSIVQVRGPLPLPQAIAICQRAVEALAEIHKVDAVHGDLKPENVVVGATSDGEVCTRLSDAVIAALAARLAPRLGVGGTALGTPLYRAPELRTGAAASSSSDVYAAGAILYEQLAGVPPFDGASCLAVERMQLRGEPMALRRRAPARAIGPAVDDVVMRALSRDPADRYADASALANALRGAATEDAQNGASPGSRGRDGRSGLFGLTTRRTLVGRTDLVEAVLAAASWPPTSSPHDAETPRGSVVIVLGGAGMGKSAIANEVVERLTGGATAVLRVDGRRAVTRPLEPFTELARDLLGIDRAADSESVAAVSAVLHGSFGFDAEDVVRLVDRVTARQSSLAVAAEVIEREEVASLRAFVGRVVASRPTLLLVEDADSLDPASIELVRDLMHAARSLPFCVLLTARSDPWPEWTAPHATRAYVPSLDDDASKALLRARLAGRGIPTDAVELAVAWTRGSPLLLELCARAMIRRELLVGGDGRWVPPSSSQDLFGGMRELVAMAMRAARPAARRWISCAALSAHRTPVALLNAWESTASQRDEILQSCLGTGMLRLSHEHLVFDNEGVREIVQALVPEAERRQIRAFLARWLQETEPARAPAEVIAAHLEAAGEVAQAATMFEREANELLARGEPRGACALFRRAESLFASAGDLPAAIRAGLSHAEGLLQSGDGRAVSDALAQLERHGTFTADGLRARAAAAVAVSQGDSELALNALRRASDVAVDSLDQLAWYKVEVQLAELLHRLGRFEDAQTHASLSLELARSLADEEGKTSGLEHSGRVSQAAAFLSRVLLTVGRLEDARSVLQRALEQAALVGDEASAARLLANLAHAWSVDGDATRALEFGQRALEFARRAGDRMAIARVALNVGTYQSKLGRVADANRSFALAKASARSVGWDKGVRLARAAVAALGPQDDK